MIPSLLFFMELLRSSGTTLHSMDLFGLDARLRGDYSAKIAWDMPRTLSLSETCHLGRADHSEMEPFWTI